MPVETATNIGDLNPLYPTGGEKKSDGDDHLRNLKAAIRQSFAGFTGAVCVTGADAGALNAYTLTPATALTAYSPRMIAVFSPLATNTGAATLNISGLGAKSILRVDGTPVTSNDLVAGRLYSVIYNGTAFQLDAMTQNYVDQLALGAILPGQAGKAGKFLTTDGTNASFESIDLRGSPVANKGNSGTTTQVIDYTAGEGQTLTATGSFTLTTAGWPTGRIAAVMLRLTNGGAFSLSSTGITWIKSDGSFSTTFAGAGVSLQAAGTDMILLFSYGDGVVYAKVAR